MSDTHMHPGVSGMLEEFPRSYRQRPKCNLEQSQALFNYSSCLLLKSGTRYVGTDNEPVSQISVQTSPDFSDGYREKQYQREDKANLKIKKKLPNKCKV